MKKAKEMPSRTSEEENGVLDAGDGTDIELHDSLPYDVSKIPKSTDCDIETPTNKIPVSKSKYNGEVSQKNHKEKNQRYNEREDSIISGWSDIPEIRIIQTESAENLDGGNIDNDKSCQKKQARKIKLKEIKDKVEKHIEERAQKLKMEETETKNCRKELKGKKLKDLKCSPKTQRKLNEIEKQSIIANEEQAESNKKYKLNNKDKIDNKGLKSNCKTNGLRSKKQKAKDLKKSDEDLKDNPVMLPDEPDSPLPTNSFDILTSIENQEYANSSESIEDGTEEYSHDEDSYCYSDSGDKIEPDGEKVKHKISNEHDLTNKTTQSKEQKKKTNTKLNTESEDSDLSSQNTVKQNVEQSKISKENKSSLVHCGKEKTEPSFKIQSSKDQNDTKKFMARFKIANVLLKEARRRSSSGLEDH